MTPPRPPPPARRPALAVALVATAAIACATGPAAADGEAPASGAWGASDTAIVDRRPPAETRVVGGRRDSIENWPSVVALLHTWELRTPFDRQFCGGTVIAPRWVLTAAHCLYDQFGSPMDASSLRVLAGQTNLREPSDGREIVVANVYRHPGYANDPSGRTSDDVALLEMATDVPAPSSELFAGDPESFPGRLSTIVGWGATDYAPIGPLPFPDELRSAVVPLVPFETCNGPDGYAGDVAGGQFCAGYAEGGVDSCTGDSGGPLYVLVDDRVQVAGVTSFGRGCALPGFYGIYTDVADYLDWIETYVALPIEPTPPVERGGPTVASRGPQTGGAAGDGDSGGGAAGPGALLLLLLARFRGARPPRAGRRGA